jgi:drug/metabolite transporter (DMT)-like permease
MGLLAALLGAVFSTAKDLVSKRVAARLDGTTSTFASFAFALPYYVLVLAALVLAGRERLEVSLPFLLLVFLRSVTDSFAEGMKMHAFAHGDISVVASFFSLSPLFLLITSPLITGDLPSGLGVLAVLLVVAGSVLMVWRPGDSKRPAQTKGVLLALGAAVFFSFNSCFDRLAVQKGTPVFAGFSMTLFSALLLLPFIVSRRQRVRELVLHRGDFALRGLLEIAFMTSKLYALQYLQAPYVVGVQRLALILSIIGGRVFFKEEEFARRLAAGGCILAGVVLIVVAQR